MVRRKREYITIMGCGFCITAPFPTFRFASSLVVRRKTPKDLCTTPLPPPNNGLHNILKIRKHSKQWGTTRES